MLVSPIIISVLLGPISTSSFSLSSSFEKIISHQSYKALDYDIRRKNNRNDKQSATTSQFCNNRPLKALSTNYLTNRIIIDNEVDNEEWEAMLGLLVEFQEREGHLVVPHNEEDIAKEQDELLSLGLWLKIQRQKEKKGIIDLNQKRRMEDVGIVWNLSNQRWEDAFRLTMEFKEREGHCNIPQRHKEKEKELGKWVFNQRTWKKTGKLLHPREERLKEIGFVFDQLGNSWDKMYQNLQMFKEREGHCVVPSNHKENEKKIGQWLMLQRQKKRNGKLERLHEEKLTKIGVDYDTLAEQRWENMFQLLLQFRDREGHCRVPRYHKENGQNLGMWLATLVQSKKDGKLDPIHEKNLLGAGAILRWKNRDALWNEMFQLFLQFKAREGHCNIPQKHKENGSNLGTWVTSQRRQKVLGKMKDLREERLQEAGFIFANNQSGNIFKGKNRDALWDETFQLLLQFKKREGNCNVPSKHKENENNLGRWVATQRRHKIFGKMSAAREDRLQKAGFIFGGRNQNKWEEMFQLLLEFKEREGHCIVPQKHKEDGRNLGTWVTFQRRLKVIGRMSAAREELLQEVGFIFAIYYVDQWEDTLQLVL